MHSIDQHIQVAFRYSVHFTTGVFDPANQTLANLLATDAAGPKRALFVIDEGLLTHHPQLIDAINQYCRSHDSSVTLAGQPMVLPGGEAAKNDPRHIQSLYEAVRDARICRHSFIIAVGGGALIDLAGYAAATAHRGVRIIRVPTTVLAQNDASIGVKNSVNFLGRKNFLGTFAPPFAVVNDANFLTTLSDRDWRAGTVEAVKVGLIKDAAFFRFIHQNAAALVRRDMPAMQKLIHRCAELHLQHIAGGGDPFETGTSRPLDFGHWAAHKLEQMTDFRLRHGEAVSIGIALDTIYAGLIGLLPEPDVREVCQCLVDLGLPVYDAALADRQAVLDGLEEFREHLGGRLTIMLLRRIGQGHEVHEIDRSAMLAAMDRLALQPIRAGAVG